MDNWKNSEIRFRHLRHQSGLTLREVENQTGISNSYLSQLENGKIANPSFKTVVTLLELYKLPLVSPEIADFLIKIRDFIVTENYDEAYYYLLKIADPDINKIDHWAKLEGLAKSSTITPNP